MSSPLGRGLRARPQPPVTIGLALTGLLVVVSYGGARIPAEERSSSLREYTVVVTGEGSVDGRTAGSLGDAVLVVPRSGLTDGLVADVQLLQPTRLLVLGGPEVVTPEAVAELSAATTTSVTRLAGRDRYETAARAALATFSAPVQEVAIVTSDAPPVAAGVPGRGGVSTRGGCRPSVRLCGSDSAVVGVDDVPVLLVTRDGVPAATAAALQRLRPERVSVVGAASAAVLRDLQAHAPGEVRRVPAG